MPFFSFSINETNLSLKKFNITENTIYFSKNTELWKILNKKHGLNVQFLRFEKRNLVNRICKKILFCLPPAIGLGDAIEYASALQKISESTFPHKISIAFSGDLTFVFRDYFKLKNIYPYIIKKNEIEKFETIFHPTLEIKSLANQKYSRSDICKEVMKFFKIKNIQSNEKINHAKYYVNRISIFPISSSPIRTMPPHILNQLIELLSKNYNLEVVFDQNSKISNFLYENVNTKKVFIVDPKSKKDLFSLIKKIEYGLFMDSGPLHIAKMFNKRGILLETSVSARILLRNYKFIKGIENSFSSSFCNAPCGLTDIFNFKNKHGCYDSLNIKSLDLKNKNFKNVISRGVKDYYLKNYINSVGCVSSLNISNIYNTIRKDLSL